MNTKTFLAATSLFLLTFQSRAGDCPLECTPQPACQKEILDCLLGAGQTRQAIEHFRKLQNEQPQEVEYRLYLARAYLADNNPVWARRVLQEALEQGDSCTLRGWLAWVLINQGELDQAGEVLGREGCPVTAAERTRFKLLEAFIAGARGEKQAGEILQKLYRAEAFFGGDEKLFFELRSRYLPGWMAPVSLRLETGFGYTSNARAGAPADPDSRGEASALGRVEAFGRFSLPLPGVVRPALEAGFKGQGIGREKEREFSYLELSARPGLIFGSFPRAFVAYHGDYLVLARDTEAERRFYEGHRAELELEIGDFSFFAGFGRRIFRESGRTRFEFDGGGGGAFSLSPRFSLLGALSLRVYQARGMPYDLYGGTALVAARYALGRGFLGRLLFSLGLDDYYNSGGELGLLAYGSDRRRRDLLIKSGLELWTPPWQGLRAAAGYEVSWRNSTLDESNSTQVYDYTEHRLLVRLRWEFDWDAFRPRLDPPAAGLELNFAPTDKEDLGAERIQDLLRQDESARRGSSCVQ